MSEVQILLLLLLSGYLISVSLGMVIIPRILVISHKKRLYDVPDSRKVHTTPVPRLGGLSFFPVVLMSFALVIGFRLYLNVFMPCSLSVRWESSCLSGATMSLAMPTAGISSSWAMLGV